jgi:uncharacterized protein YjbI with pentapeptide repeats
MRRRSEAIRLTLTLVSLASVAVTPLVSAQRSGLTRQRVQSMLAEKRSLIGANMSDLDLSGLDFTGADLSGAVLRGANLSGSIFADAILVKANLTGAQLRAAVFVRTQLEGANLARAEGIGLSLREVNMKSATLDGAQLPGANLEGAILTRASLLSTDLRQANLSRATLDEARLVRTDLRNAKLIEASLRRAQIVGVDMSGADLHGTILAGAEIESTDVEKAHNHAKAIYDEPAATPVPQAQIAAAPWTARIYTTQGTPIEVESWSVEGSLIFYVKDGATHGIPSNNVTRIEDRAGKLLRDTPEVLALCRRPKVGDSEQDVTRWFNCVNLTWQRRTTERAGGTQTIYSTDPETLRVNIAPILVYVTDGKVTEVVSGTLDPSKVEPTRPTQPRP